VVVGPVVDLTVGSNRDGSKLAMLREYPLVLLVDNDADNHRGFRVIPCSDSQTSIDVARGSQPDIILLELRMTGMNGIQVLRELRKDPGLARVPVVALTASVMARERAAADAAGFTELLPKPFFPENLATAVTQIIAAAHSGERGQERLAMR